MEPVRRRRIGLVPLLVVASLAFGQGAHAEAASTTVPSSERTTFEEGLGPWRGHRASVAVVRTRFHGRAARVSARNRGFANFAILRRAVLGAQSGTAYTATGMAQARSGVICLRLREIQGYTTLRHSTRCVRVHGGWRRLPSVSLTKVGTTTGLSVTVFKRKSRWGRDGFLVDGVVVTPAPTAAARSAGRPDTASASARRHLAASAASRSRSGSGSGPGRPPPAPPPPPASTSGQFGTQFHCMWGHYTNAQRTAALDKLDAAGVQWVRIDVGWYGVEDTHKGARNSWYLGNADFCVDEARERGLKVLVTLWATPGWANGGAARETASVEPGRLRGLRTVGGGPLPRPRGRVGGLERAGSAPVVLHGLDRRST